MKKYIALVLIIVLTATAFAGCRSKNDTGSTTAPTVLPTIERPTKEPTETPTVGPTEASTAPTVTMGTEETGSTDETTIPDSTGMDTTRSGRRIPSGR